MSAIVEEHKISDVNRHSLDNPANNHAQQSLEDEIIHTIENSPEKDILISVLTDYIEGVRMSTHGLQVLRLINSITNDITGSKLDESDKTSLNEQFNKFKDLLPDSGSWIDIKVSGGAYPRYCFLLTSLFEVESRKRAKRLQDITNQGQTLSTEIEKIKESIGRIGAEKDSVQRSLQADLETKALENDIIEKPFRENEQQNLIQRNEKTRVFQENKDFRTENTRLSETLANLDNNLRKLENDGLELIHQTKMQRESHFSTTRNIAVKKQEVESLYNMEEKLGPVQEEIKKYSESVKEGEQRLGKLRSELDAQVSEYKKYEKELNEHLHSHEIKSLRNQLEQEIAKREQKKLAQLALAEELKHISDEIAKIKNQSLVADLDKSLERHDSELQRVRDVIERNIQSKKESGSKSEKQKESIANLEKEIRILLENEILEDQSIQALQQESAEKSQILEHETLDFKIYEKNSLAAKRKLDEQIKQCDWKKIDKTQSFTTSFIATLLITSLCSLFCVVLYNLPPGTLYNLFDI